MKRRNKDSNRNSFFKLFLLGNNPIVIVLASTGKVTSRSKDVFFFPRKCDERYSMSANIFCVWVAILFSKYCFTITHVSVLPYRPQAFSLSFPDCSVNAVFISSSKWGELGPIQMWCFLFLAICFPGAAQKKNVSKWPLSFFDSF